MHAQRTQVRFRCHFIFALLREKSLGEISGLDPDNARGFGEFLVNRYKDYPNIIWIVGRDRPIEEDVHREINIAMAEGLRAGDEVIAWWYNPRTGEADRIGTFSSSGTKVFSPPTPGEKLDWVLVLDDASHNYPAPGSANIIE